MLFRNGEKILFGQDLEIIDTIPKGVWLLMSNEGQTVFEIEKQPNFTLPEKIYGKDTDIFQRFIDTFNCQTNESLGVLLSGYKGSGKSCTAKRTCIELDIPIILLTQPFVGEDFLSFLSKITQDVVIFIDEFEKVYSTFELQAQFLPILDGVFESKKLFLFTTNTEEINEFLVNRPGRIKYHIKYDRLGEATKKEIIEDLLDNQDNSQGLLSVLDVLGRVSIDVLLHIIKEMNLYNEEAKDVIKFLNVKIEDTNFNVRCYIDGSLYNTTIRYNPLVAEYIYISYKDAEGRFRYYEKEKEMMQIEINGEEFEFRDNKGNKFIFTRFTPYKFEL